MHTKKQLNAMYIKFLLCCAVLLLTGCQGTIDGAAKILINLQQSYNAIVDLIISVAYLSGAGFVMKGVFAFKLYGEQRTMMSSQVSIRVPVAYLAVGVGLLYLPAMISLASNSVFMDPEVKLIGYNVGDSPIDKVKNAVFATIQIMGLVSIMRAFFSASVHHPPGGGGGQGGMGKSALHFLGGLAALNIEKMIDIMHNVFVG